MRKLLQRVRRTWATAGPLSVLTGVWSGFWMQFADLPLIGAVARRLAAIGIRPYYGRQRLAGLARKGYRSPSAKISHDRLETARHVYIADQVIIYDDGGDGEVVLGEHVRLHDGVYLQTGPGGSIRIGERTHIQARCHFSAYAAPIDIGAHVQIAPNCAFHSYDHEIDPNRPIHQQGFTTRGPISVGEGAWIGVGTIVLSGVTIGVGAVVGAGSVVTRDIPDMAIAVGHPARVVGFRGGAGAEATSSATPPATAHERRSQS